MQTDLQTDNLSAGCSCQRSFTFSLKSVAGNCQRSDKQLHLTATDRAMYAYTLTNKQIFRSPDPRPQVGGTRSGHGSRHVYILPVRTPQPRVRICVRSAEICLLVVFCRWSFLGHVAALRSPRSLQRSPELLGMVRCWLTCWLHSLSSPTSTRADGVFD